MIYAITRQFVLRSPNSTEMALLTYPILVWFCTTLILFYLLLKGAKGQNDALGWDPEGDDLGIAVGVCVGFGGLCALLSLLAKPFLRRKSEETSEIEAQKAAPPPQSAIDTQEEEKKGIFAFISKALDTDVDAIVAENGTVAEIHAQAEKFSPKTEIIFKYLQVITAALDSFAHGANDVANAMGPFSAIYYIYSRGGQFSKKNEMGNDMYWILAIGGLGIVTGLGIYGYKIMYAIGIKLAKITPSRGFSIELGAMFVVLLGSRFGIPLSTTHCQVGATMGVAATEGRLAATNWSIVYKTVAGWIFTMVVNGTFTATICAIGMAAIDWDDATEHGLSAPGASNWASDDHAHHHN